MPWTELAGTALDDSPVWCGNAGAPAPPACLPKSLTGGGNNLPNSVIDAWVTGAARETGEMLFPCGGGDQDWAGNQVIGCIPWTSPYWFLRRNYSPQPAYINAGTGTGSPIYADGTPAAKHTYDSVVWLPTKQRLLTMGGIYWPAFGSTPHVCWWYNPADATWAQKGTRPGGYATASCWDSTANRVLVRQSGNLMAYNPDLEDAGANAAAWTQLFSQSGSLTSSSSLALDPLERKVYRLDCTNRQLLMTDLNNLGAKEVILPTAGDVAWFAMVAPGLIFSEGRLVALGYSNPDTTKVSVYTADPKQTPVTWLRHGHATEPPSQINDGKRGIWKKFWGPVNSGKYYYVNQWTHNIWQYTPDWSATTHTVDEARGLLVEMVP